MNYASQPDMVRGSLQMLEQRDHRRDAPSSRRGVARLANDGREAARVSATHVVEAAASHAPDPEEAGQDGWGQGHAQTCRKCGAEWGEYASDRYITGESSWTGDLCPTCAWDTLPGTERPVPRVIPGSRRVM